MLCLSVLGELLAPTYDNLQHNVDNLQIMSVGLEYTSFEGVSEVIRRHKENVHHSDITNNRPPEYFFV